MLDKYIARRFGFAKTKEDEHGAVYERRIAEFGYTHVVCIHKKNSGQHLIQSYDKDLMDVKKIGNCGVGMEIKMMIPFWLKARWLSHKYHWNRRSAKK